MPLDLVGGDLPLPIGGGVAVGVPPTDVDVLVDQVPLWLQISPETPYQRATAQFQRQQIDQQPEAGEASLAGWWTRSQMSWHLGAGLDYLDTLARPDDADRLRFHDSLRVDPWTPGTLSRLRDTSTIRSSTSATVWVEPTSAGCVLATAAAVELYDGATFSPVDYGSAFPVRAFCTDGANWYAATIDGVYRGSLSGGAGTLVYTLPSTDVPMCLGWVKQRLMLGHGPDVYALDQPGPALPTKQYTHPVASWRWTAFADSPTGILACGYAGMQSGIIRFEITDIDNAPVLGAGGALVSMPLGETINAACLYMGSLLVLGTSRGLRVSTFDGLYATFTLGPLSYDDSPVTAVGGYDRYVWAGCGQAGTPASLRVDLGAPISDAGHYAWAPDLPVAGQVTAWAFMPDGRKWIGQAGVGLAAEATASALGDAYLETARIRMATVEDKHWVYGTVRGVYDAANPIRVEVSTDGVTWTQVHEATVNAERFEIRAPKSEWLQLRFHLVGTAQLSSYQVQAVPGGKRQRLIQLPVSISDYHLTRSGIEVGYPGWGRERLRDLEVLEEAGAVITVSAPALFPEAIRGVIEELTYLQPNDPGDQGSGTGGGVLQLILRTTS